MGRMHVAVLGANAVGRDLAQVLATAGHTVGLQDAEANPVMDAIDHVERRLRASVDAGDLRAADREDALDRLDATTGLEAAVGEADLVVVTETADVGDLQARLADLEPMIGRETVVATTGAEPSITAAAAGLRHPDRAVGLTLDDPLDAAIVEVIVADQTSADTVERVEALFADLDRATAVAADHPGLVSTRLTVAVEVEAMRIVEDGVASVPDVDDAYALRHGHPMGPLERADRAGLDRRLETLTALEESLGERFAPPGLLADLVADGRTGAESRGGFYEWENGEPVGSALPDPGIVDRAGAPDDPDHR